ncbi:hypothetical protein [Streptomyces sp. NPDC059072]|uniref:hypothetical protein n=1 Tax=Streptomyces sp. NPDC059072 TaxID=3346715 RepID=UPI0036A0412E
MGRSKRSARPLRPRRRDRPVLLCLALTAGGLFGLWSGRRLLRRPADFPAGKWLRPGWRSAR